MLKIILNQYFELLEKNSIDYCVIGNYEKLPEYTSNDVDFWVEDKKQAEQILLKLAKELNIQLYMQNKTANGTNNYFYYKHLDNTIEIIKIDLMSETAYKSIIPLVKSDFIKNNRKRYKNFYIANEFVEGIMHLFYPLVTYGIIKEKYRDKLHKMIYEDSFQNEIKNMLGKELSKELIENIKHENWLEIEKNALNIRKYFIKKMMMNVDYKRIKIIINFLSSIMHRLFTKNGLVISFTGIDGAGKTSIKEDLVKNSDKYFAKARIKEFYWRPFLLPTVAKMVGTKSQKEQLDASGRRVIKTSLSTKVKSYIKYIYYILDFVFGQIKYFKESHTGGLVVFDRYHFDNVIYPERFGFSVNKSFMRFVDKWIIPQPDLLFYLTADSKVLYERKYEIDIEEINKQKDLYNTEINIRGNVTTVSTDKSFEESKNEILLYCLEFMAKRVK